MLYWSAISPEPAEIDKCLDTVRHECSISHREVAHVVALQVMHVIVSGTAVVRRNGRKISELGAGETIGEMALFDDGPRTASVVASTDMETLQLSRRALKGIIDSTPSVAHKLLTELAGRLRRSNRKLYG